MIDTFARQFDYAVSRYKEQKSKNVADVFGERRTLDYDEEKWYPDDLENLIGYLMTLQTQATSSHISEDMMRKSPEQMGSISQLTRSDIAPTQSTFCSSFTRKKAAAKKE